MSAEQPAAPKPWLVQRRLPGKNGCWADVWIGEADSAESAMQLAAEQVPEHLLEHSEYRAGILPVWETFRPKIKRHTTTTLELRR